MKRAWCSWVATWGALLAVAASIATFQTSDLAEGRYIFAASTLILTAVLHSFLGERYILGPLFRRDDPPTVFNDDRFVPRTLRFVWHLFSIAFVGSAAILIALVTEAPPTTVPRIISATAAGSAVVACLVSRGRHLSWIAFSAVALATWSAAP